MILDEFQEIERLGAEGAGASGVSPLRQLRAVVQQQSHVTYAFPGSDARLIAAVQARENGALYILARRYVIGPIEPEHFAGWIEAQFGAMGIEAKGQGRRIIDVAGPRTRDVRTLGESVAECTRQSGRVSEEGIVAGMLNLLRERAASYEMSGPTLTPLQQNVLRAVAAEGRGLARAATRKEFALGDASRVTKAVDALVERDVLLRHGARTVFDDPFYRAWVVVHVLPDVGRHHAVTYLPEE